MSERKKAHLIKLNDAYNAAIKVVHDNEGKKLSDYKKKIVAEGCFHPFTWERTESDDDGYGRWYTRKVTECSLCGEKLDVKYNH